MKSWPFWRKLMLAGALWLLVVAIAQDGFRAPGTFLDAAAIALGYGMLAAGFYFAMRDR